MNTNATSYALHGTTLALAWFFIVNVLLAAAVAAVTRALVARGRPVQSRIWLALRLLPGAAAALFVAAMFVPSYWKYEPVEAAEGFDVTLTLCATAAVVVIAAAGVRGIGAWRTAYRRTAEWMRTARPLPLAGTSILAYEIPADAPLMALAGVVRPRLLVTRGLISALTEDELAASVAHELGHWRAFDNLKRLLMRAAPDLLTSTRTARTLEQSWAAGAEHYADQLASGEDPSRRCALASALVKVARLRPCPTPMGEPISTLIGGGDLASRVRDLLEVTQPAAPVRRMTPLVTGLSLVAIASAYIPLLLGVHFLTEVLVRVLP